MDESYPPRPRLLTASVMARLLKVTKTWLEAEAREGHIPHLNAGGRLLFDREAVEQCLLKRARCEGVAVGLALQ